MVLRNPPVMQRLLGGLGRYRYLTVSQYLRAFGGDGGTARDNLRDLEKARHVKRFKWSDGADIGRLGDMWWLTPAGAERASNTLGEDITAPNQDPSERHLRHRMLTVSALVAADRWARDTGRAMPQIRTYMGGTQVVIGGYAIDPDAIITITDEAEGNPRVYVVEAHCSHYGGGRHMHPVEKMELYAKEGQFLDFDAAFGVIDEVAPRVGILSVCDTPTLRDRLIGRVPERPGVPPRDRLTWSRMLFKSAKELDDFGAGWWNMDGEAVKLPT